MVWRDLNITSHIKLYKDYRCHEILSDIDAYGHEKDNRHQYRNHPNTARPTHFKELFLIAEKDSRWGVRPAKFMRMWNTM